MLFKIAPGDFVSPIYALSRAHLRGLKIASELDKLESFLARADHFPSW
jgi:hypothetical protein